MPIAFAMPAPRASSEPTVVLPQAMTWTGFNGAEWDLTSDTGTLQMRRGVKGLHMPKFTVFESETPLVHGTEVRGYTIEKRSAFWPLTFYARSRAEWEAAYGAFFGSMHPVMEGLWTVGKGDAARTLPLTYRDDGSYAFHDDPFVSGLALIGVELEAPRPLWRGKAVSRTFHADDPTDFIPSEPGETYHPSPSATFATSEIPNPGKEPAYLRWVIDGPHPEGMGVGVGGAVIEVPFPVPDGSVLAIDTDPAQQFATLDGVDCTRELGFQMFAPVLPGGASPLVISAAGGGSVTATLVPLHWTAQG